MSTSNSSSPPPLKLHSAPFFSPRLHHARRHAYSRWTLTTALLCTMILCLLSIYWGALSRVDSHLAHLSILIVDYDTGDLVGPIVTRMIHEHGIDGLGAKLHIPDNAEREEKEGQAAVRAVYDESHWAALIVRSNATGVLEGGIAAEAFDEKAMMQLVYVQARQETVLSMYILPRIREFERRVQRAVTAAVLQRLKSEPRDVTPTLLNPGIEFEVFNLRPFGPPVSLPAVTVGQIYLIVFSFFSFSFYLPVHSRLLIPHAHTGTPPLRFTHWILFRIIATATAYFLFSFFYSLISLIFRIPFTLPPCASLAPCRGTAYGRASFPVYWALNFVGTLALGFPCENVGMIVGFPYLAIWLIFWVITNVVVSFYAIPLAPAFYRYGYAWPVFHIVRGSRTLLFDTKSYIGVDFGVLLAWAVVSILLFPFCCRFAAWKMLREREREGKLGREETRRERDVRRGSVVRNEYDE